MRISRTTIRALSKRIEALAVRMTPAPIVEEAATEGPRRPEDEERALVAELLDQARALQDAVDTVPTATWPAAVPRDPWRLGDEEFNVLFRAKALPSALVRRIVDVGRVLSAGLDGLVIVRPEGGRLARSDGKRVLAAKRQGHPFVILPAAPALGGLGIDIKAEMTAIGPKQREVVPCN